MLVNRIGSREMSTRIAISLVEQCWSQSSYDSHDEHDAGYSSTTSVEASFLRERRDYTF